ncbi:peroxiredoxin [Qipengyuania qiaonensis]|uniref:thioredoxin-dependent peroxiredoxin n=1 Tax=Qipengyuania qiaonensis TaxID=2867240 RepID=A0ABS7J862_9SPHN|nr:peroxiredoxin [Qipengyuania qiaonensis]MBX7481167.1 peroxiredoxin [Qipengyuania qiaonensis]
MKIARALLAAAALGFAAAPTLAALDKGEEAPRFAAQGAMAGKPIRVDLGTSLKKGPVVLYFFPAAFTSGCNLEAQTFAAAMDDFRKAGATVIGMTGGNTNQLRDFSAKHCAGQFPVASASKDLIDRYDVSLGLKDEKAGWSDRTTYVIDTDGRIAFVYSDLKPQEHVARSLAAVRSLASK